MLIALETAILAGVAPSAQTPRGAVDHTDSFAVMQMGSTKDSPTGFVAVAGVAGTLDTNDNETSSSRMRISIFPAGAESIIASDGDLVPGAYADLADYTVLTYHSRQAVLRSDGAIEFSGSMTLSHVVRRPTMHAGLDYSGADLASPTTQTTTHDVTFLLKKGEIGGSAVAAIAIESFPELRAALLDSSWPPLVQSKSCYIPQNSRDYYGAVCSGRTIDWSTPAGTPRFGIDYPGFDTSEQGGGDLITIVLNLRVRSSK